MQYVAHTGSQHRMKTVAVEILGNVTPKYETEGAAGFDIAATEARTIVAFTRSVVPTGLRLAVPVGYELQIRPRSGLAAKSGITVLNTPGTIDSDYRGEIGVILFNTSADDFHINVGDRIAQGVLSPIVQAAFVSVEELSTTERGEGGFGSTGV